MREYALTLRSKSSEKEQTLLHFSEQSQVIRYGPLVLRNAVTGDADNKDLWNWIKQVIDGGEDAKNLSIVVMVKKVMTSYDLT